MALGAIGHTTACCARLYHLDLGTSRQFPAYGKCLQNASFFIYVHVLVCFQVQVPPERTHRHAPSL